MWLLAASVQTAKAQAAPSIGDLTPRYVQRSETKEITIAGEHLADVTAAVIPDPRGVDANLVAATTQPAGPTTAPASVKETKKPKSKKSGKKSVKSAPDATPAAVAPSPPPIVDKDRQTRVTLTVKPDATPGVRELRLVAPSGVTAPLMILVGQYPGQFEKEPNNTADQATAIELPANLGGRIDSPGDVDLFRFRARKNQHIIFNVYMNRIASKLDAILTILDPSGREVSHTEERHDGDPLVVFDAPADGQYLLHVRDLQYRGGADFTYRIDAGEIPYLSSLLPMSGRRGAKVQVKATGHNLQGADTISLDLSAVAPGSLPVRVTTDHGVSNALNFNVTDLAQATEVEPNDSPDVATKVVLPSEISGALQRPGDEDFFRFTVPVKQKVILAVQAPRSGSAVDALLTLRKAGGEELEISNGTADAAPRITRDLDVGDYVVCVRDLTFAGGPGYGYRLDLGNSPATPPDFSLRFLPDTLRLPRGGNTKLWCEVTRLNGYKGDVTVKLDGLPPGVTSAPAVMSEKTSGIFTLSASADAKLVTVPLRVKVIGNVGGEETARDAKAELDGRVVQQAYLTVTPPAPVTIDALALLKPEQLTGYGAQVADLYAKLNAKSPELDAAQVEWEKKLLSTPQWTVLNATGLNAAKGTTLTQQADGSILAGGEPPEKETYTVVATADDVKEIAAIALETLTDESLPGNGPGRAGGNFVLSKFTVTAAPKDDPAKSQPLEFAEAHASFDQIELPASAAVGLTPGKGWAVYPQMGRDHSAIFGLKTPLKFPGGAVLTFTLDHQYGQQHTLGRFRLLTSADPAAAKGPIVVVPRSVHTIAGISPNDRTPQQKAEITEYYRSISPLVAGARAGLEALRRGIGPYAEIARLEAIVAAPTPTMEAEMKQWESTALTGGWSLLDVIDATSANGTVLSRETDGSFFANGANPANDTYTLSGSTALHQIAAVRLEALPDDRLPGNGPGRAPGGNFLLSNVTLAVEAAAPAPTSSAKSARNAAKTNATKAKSKKKQKRAKGAAAAAPTTAPATVSIPVEFASVNATVQQDGYPASNAIDANDQTGWGIAPSTGRPVSAVFVAKASTPAAESRTRLTLTLRQNAKEPNHTIGRFRIWVTGSADPIASRSLPPNVVATLRIPADKRSPAQKAELAAYFQTIAPSLTPVRQRLAEYKTKVAALPLTTTRARAVLLPVPITRADGFTGDVQITLEGFSTGRDPANQQPAPSSRNLILPPLTIKGGESFGVLNITPNIFSEAGTRMVVLRAEAKVGNDTFVQYSPVFPFTVAEK